MISCGNPEKAARVLGWQAKYQMQDVVRMMVDSELKLMKELDL